MSIIIHTPEIPGRADIAVVMITVDRSPKRNYLRETIDSLERGGVFTSERLRSFTLVLGQPITEVSESYRYIDARSAFPMISAHRRLLPCENAGRALILGSKLASAHPQGWVLFLEDDIDCCADFLGSVGRWLDRYGDNPSWRSALYQFGCSYPQICQTQGGVWQYSSPSDFYGTQAIAMRPTHAQAIGTVISSRPKFTHLKEGRKILPSEYDLMIGHWAAAWDYQIAASAPSFIQHIGVESSLSDRPTCHTFPSWPGREWSYK